MDDGILWPVCGLVMLAYAVSAFAHGSVLAGAACLGVAWSFARITWATLRDAELVGGDDPLGLEDTAED